MSHRNAVKLRCRIRELLDPQMVGYGYDVKVNDTQGATTLLVWASIDGGPEEMFEVIVRPVER